MNTLLRVRKLVVILAAFFFAWSVLVCISNDAYAQPTNVILRNRQNPPKKKEEEKKEEKKEENKDENKDSSDKSKVEHSYSGDHDRNYSHRRDNRYDDHYKFWIPTYQRVVDIYFREAYAELNEGFFFDEKEKVEYLPGEWFDIILNFECYAVVNGEDIKVRYTVMNDNGEELQFGKVFIPIFNGSNEKTVARAFPASYLDTYGKLYIDLILTIEGNDAYGGFWLETVPGGNEGPVRVGEVILSDTYYGAESDPVNNLVEGKTYKLWAEYEVDEYLSEPAAIEWRLYDSGGRDIAGEKAYVQPNPGYSVFSTTFDMPDPHFAGTRGCYLDVSLTSAPYIGRQIMQINVTGDEIVTPYVGDPTGGALVPPTKGATPWDVTFVMADVLTLGSAKKGQQLYAGDDLYGMFEYVISGLQRDSEERLKWSLYGPDGFIQSGEEKATVKDGTQNRYIKLPIGSDAAPGQYYMNLEIWIDSLYTRGTQAMFQLNASPQRVKVEMEGADENYFEFQGFNLFLPYSWDVAKQDNGITFVTGKSVVGSLNSYPMHRADHEGESLKDMAEAYEDVPGVKLTSVQDTVNGHDVFSTSYLQSGSGSEIVDLYAYFIVDRTTDTFDFWVMKMSTKSSQLKELYEDYKEFKDGLFFP